MTTERDVASLAEDIQTMVGSYTSFMEGIALQDAELAWDLAEKYADRLRDMTRELLQTLRRKLVRVLGSQPRRSVSVGLELPR